MKTKRDLFVTAVLSFCIVAVLFMAFPTMSQTSIYDPWADVSGPTVGEPDGTINMRDIQYEILHFNTFGIPVNRTYLLEAQSQIENLTTLILELQSRMDSLNATVIEQQNTINNLNQTVVYLNETITILNGTGLGAPDYDSGWVTFTNYYMYLTHNLNTTDIIVYMIGRSPGSDLSHQHAIGGDCTTLNNDHSYGAFWGCVDRNTISVNNALRGYPDNWWASVRVLIWKIL